MNAYGIVLFEGDQIGAWRIIPDVEKVHKLELNLEDGWVEKVTDLSALDGTSLQFLADPGITTS